MNVIETAVERSTSQAAEALETMLTIREFETTSAGRQASGKHGSVCTSVGQEASAVGVVRALASHDLILTNHRSAGHLIARGADPGRLFAEIGGKATGYCKGKSGPLHISVKELGVLLTSTIVGGELSLAPGVGLSLSMQETDAIVTVFFGDGAATEGIFHEALNLAAVWELPVLFVCENNQFQAFVHRKETMLTDHVSEWAHGYGMPAVTVDGNDVEAVNAAAKTAVEYVRKNRKPYFLETYTYRLRGHMEPDTQGYVDKDELASWQKKDPIATLEARLLEQRTLTILELEEMKVRVQRTIESTAAFADASPYPPFDEMTTDVYA